MKKKFELFRKIKFITMPTIVLLFFAMILSLYVMKVQFDSCISYASVLVEIDSDVKMEFDLDKNGKVVNYRNLNLKKIDIVQKDIFNKNIDSVLRTVVLKSKSKNYFNDKSSTVEITLIGDTKKFLIVKILNTI